MANLRRFEKLQLRVLAQDLQQALDDEQNDEISTEDLRDEVAATIASILRFIGHKTAAR